VVVIPRSSIVLLITRICSILVTLGSGSIVLAQSFFMFSANFGFSYLFILSFYIGENRAGLFSFVFPIHLSRTSRLIIPMNSGFITPTPLVLLSFVILDNPKRI